MFAQLSSWGVNDKLYFAVFDGVGDVWSAFVHFEDVVCGDTVFGKEFCSSFGRHDFETEVLKFYCDLECLRFVRVGDAIKNGEIQLVINTPAGKLSKHDDSYIRKAAIKYKIPYVTTTAAAVAAAKGIAAYRQNPGSVKSLQNYHAGIK